MHSTYYTYVYLNPRKPGRYTYNNFITFLYEPFYVGKGKGPRYYVHLHEANNLRSKSTKWINKNYTNPHKLHTIIGILNGSKSPIVIKMQSNLTDEQANLNEVALIDCIGRCILQTGPITHLTNGGTGGDTISNHPNKQQIIEKYSKTLTGSKQNRTYTTNTAEHNLAVSKGLQALYDSEKGTALKQQYSNTRLNYFQTDKGKQQAQEHSKKLLHLYQTPEGIELKKRIGQASTNRQLGTKRGPYSEQARSNVAAARKKQFPLITFNCEVCGIPTTLRLAEKERRFRKYNKNVCKPTGKGARSCGFYLSIASRK